MAMWLWWLSNWKTHNMKLWKKTSPILTDWGKTWYLQRIRVSFSCTVDSKRGGYSPNSHLLKLQ